MKTISRLAVCLMASAVLFCAAPANAAKVVSSKNFVFKTFASSTKSVSPYLALKWYAVTNVYLQGQIHSYNVYTSTWQAYVHYGQADNWGPPYNAICPVDISVLTSLATSHGTFSQTVVVPAGTYRYISVEFHSTTRPVLTLYSPTNPQTISMIPIEVINM